MNSIKKNFRLLNGKYSLDLDICGTLVRMQSLFKPVDLLDNPFRPEDERLASFAVRSGRRPDVLVNVSVAAKLPPLPRARAFTTYHPEDGKENWSLYRAGSRHVFYCPLRDKEQVLTISGDLSRVDAVMLAKRGGAMVWDPLDIVYDFLQILLIYRITSRGEGLLLHACGLRDTDGRGYIFAGKSGAGKSTTAKLWHRNSRAGMLNDDRVVVLRRGNGFVMYNPPWHGEVGGQLKSYNKPSRLDKIFFIGKGRRNSCKTLAFDSAFRHLYPCLFPPSWDRAALSSCLALGGELLSRVPCCKLNFVKNRKVIGFVRALPR
ncbi:MAG: hypothetical protein GX410_04715 [Elusimicrobia bacterium]|nr:hypothetical protein [Elusimicrobiota bacterium]